MTYYVSSGTLNLTKPKPKLRCHPAGSLVIHVAVDCSLFTSCLLVIFAVTCCRDFSATVGDKWDDID